jgi:hypothetical protein
MAGAFRLAHATCSVLRKPAPWNPLLPSANVASRSELPPARLQSREPLVELDSFEVVNERKG